MAAAAEMYVSSSRRGDSTGFFAERFLHNKERFCKTVAAVPFIDTYIQRNWRLQTKEIPSSGNSKQTKTQRFSETQVAISLVVRSRNSF